MYDRKGWRHRKSSLNLVNPKQRAELSNRDFHCRLHFSWRTFSLSFSLVRDRLRVFQCQICRRGGTGTNHSDQVEFSLIKVGTTEMRLWNKSKLELQLEYVSKRKWYYLSIFRLSFIKTFNLQWSLYQHIKISQKSGFLIWYILF